MSWIRLTDNYEEDSKIDRLTDGAFRLWHQVLSYCRRNQTDGLIPKAQMLSRRSYKPKRLDELMFIDPQFEDRPLVSLVEGFGFKLNAYLKWNPSRDEENERRAESRDRMRMSRERRVAPGVAPSVTRNSADCSPPVTRNTLAQLPEREGKDRVLSGKGSGENPDDLTERAARLRQESYPAWFREHRGGFLPLVASAKEMQAAIELCKGFTDQRLQQLAEVILTTNEPWIAGTDRGFWVFVKKAAWADDRLRQMERSAS